MSIIWQSELRGLFSCKHFNDARDSFEMLYWRKLSKEESLIWFNCEIVEITGKSSESESGRRIEPDSVMRILTHIETRSSLVFPLDGYFLQLNRRANTRMRLEREKK